MSMESIEIPFGAKDSELKGWEYKIPEGFEAEIKGGKIIVKQAESEDERIRKSIIAFLRAQKFVPNNQANILNAWIAYLEKQKEQHPAEWSEKDESYLQTVINEMEANKKEALEYEHKKYDTIILWLKSLHPQPHWKQSLATADLENDLCDIQDNYHDCSHEYKVLGEVIEFIRSTESHWKPSEEQMEALEQAKISAECGNFFTKDGLKSLYNDLKKLM